MVLSVYSKISGRVHVFRMLLGVKLAWLWNTRTISSHKLQADIGPSTARIRGASSPTRKHANGRQNKAANSGITNPLYLATNKPICRIVTCYNGLFQATRCPFSKLSITTRPNKLLSHLAYLLWGFERFRTKKSSLMAACGVLMMSTNNRRFANG